MYISLYSAACLEKKKTICIWKDVEAKCLFNFLYLKPSNLVVVRLHCSKPFLAFCLNENLKKVFFLKLTLLKLNFQLLLEHSGFNLIEIHISIYRSYQISRKVMSLFPYI